MPVMTGHNSGGGLGPLPGFVERIEKLEDERRLIAAEIASVKAEAKTAGFDVKVIKAILAERKLSAYERQEYARLLRGEHWHTVKALDQQYMEAQLARAGTPSPEALMRLRSARVTLTGSW